MSFWQSLAKPVRVALIIAAFVAAIIPLRELLEPVAYGSGSGRSESLATTVRWALRLWLPTAILAGMTLASAFGLYRLWRSQPAITLPQARADARQIGQWLLLALCGACLGLAPFVAKARGTIPSQVLDDVAVLGMGLCISALTAADLLGLVLVDRLNDIGLVSKAGLVALWTLHFAGPFIFPLAAYHVARRAIGRRLAETASATPMSL